MFLGILKCKRVSSPGNLRIICLIVILIVSRYNTDIFFKASQRAEVLFRKIPSDRYSGHTVFGFFGLVNKGGGLWTGQGQ